MDNGSMTALVSAFSRAYHAKNNKVKIFDDCVAEKLLGEREYTQIGENMSSGIRFFAPDFTGTAEQGLRFIVDNQLSPSPLSRAAWAEQKLAQCDGVQQYLICAAGLDTFAYRQPDFSKKLTVFEIDHPATAVDKLARLRNAKIKIPENVRFIDADFTSEERLDALRECPDFDPCAKSFLSLLGLTYYLSAEDFKSLLTEFAATVPDGSFFAFDYPVAPDEGAAGDERAKRQSALASGANEKMKADYTLEEMTALVGECGLLVSEHLTAPEITERFFSDYNKANPANPMSAFKNVSFCLAEKVAG